MNKKVVVAVAGVTGLALSAWLGSSFVAGQRAETSLQALKAAPKTQGGGLRLANLTHERGLLSSKGQAELVFEPGCSAEPGADKAISVRVDYTMSHLVMPTSATRFDWKAAPLGATADEFKAIFGSASPLAGTGSVALDGALRTEMALPEVNYQRSGEAFQIAPSKGFLTVNGQALAFGWKVDRVVTRGHGEAMELKDVALDMELKNRHLGTGWMRLGAEQVSLGMGTLEGLSVRSDASESGDRLNVTVTPAVRRVKASGVELTDLAMEIALKGMDTRSVETLSKLFEDSCGMKSLTAEEARKAREAAIRLVARGLSVGIPKISGKSADGSISGQFMVELAESKDGKPSIARQLKSNGQIEVTGKLITAEQREMAIKMGFAVAKGAGLMSGFEYQNGLLKVNERSQDASAFLAGLQSADQKLEELIASLGQAPTEMARAPAKAPAEAPAPAPAEAPAQAPAEAPAVTLVNAPAQAPAVAPAAAPAQAPAAAPAVAVACSALPGCVQQVLAAGRARNIDEVRKLAGLIDSLPKPDQGNRAVSRQLNTAGIEALKREDAAEAVAKLGQALKENPRDVEIAGNLGFALVKAGEPVKAIEVLQAALVLDPRRSSTWTPLAEAYALAGRADDARSALWVSFQWSGNRDKSLAFYQDRATRETRAPLQALYQHMSTVALQQMALPN